MNTLITKMLPIIDNLVLSNLYFTLSKLILTFA